MQRLIALALFALLLVAPAAAQDTNATADAVKDAADGSGLDGILDAVGQAAEGVQDAVGATGEGISKGAGALGGAITDALKALGEGAVKAATVLAQSGAAASAALAAAVIAIGPALGSIGAGSTGSLVVASAGVADGFLFLAMGLVNGVVAYSGLVQGLRPDAMPVAAFAAVTSVGAAGSAGAGGWAGFQALRKWGFMGTGMAGIAGFSRINNDELLEHPMRAQIFDVIKTHPGIHASQLAREMEVGWGTITHHLDKLQRGQMVTTRRVNNQKCFFEQGGDISRADMQIASALKGDTASSIAAFVQAQPMTSQKTMAEALGISPALASFHVKKLVNLGVLDKIRHGKETLLTTSDGLRRVMASSDPVVSAALQGADAGFEYTS